MPFATLPNVKLNYLQLSSSQWSLSANEQPQNLIMVHGLATSLAFWYHIAQSLTASHKVTLFDLRGHGRSSMPETSYTPSQMAEDLKELLDTLEIETADLVGHSFGGSVIVHFAIRYPHRVRKLVLADVRLKLLQPQQKPCDWSHWEQLRPNLEAVGIQIDAHHPEAGYQLLLEMARLQVEQPQGKLPFPKILSLLFPQGGSQHAAKRWLKLLETTTAAEDFRAPATLTTTQIKHLEKPTLGIYGEKSPTLATAKALQQILPHAHFHFIPQAGHFFPLSQPDVLVKAVQEFF